MAFHQALFPNSSLRLGVRKDYAADKWNQHAENDQADWWSTKASKGYLASHKTINLRQNKGWIHCCKQPLS